MNTEFCIKCGARYEYSLHKPNFCSACGEQLNETASAKVEPAKSPETQASAPEGIPAISKLEYNIESSATRLTFGDLVAQAEKDPTPEYSKLESRPVRPGHEQVDVQKQLLNECRSARGPVDVSE